MSRFITFIVACGVMLSGCSGWWQHAGQRDLVTVQLSSWGSAQEVAVLQRLLQTFEALHPGIRVELLHIPENYYQKLHILIAGGQMPDVVFINSFYFPVYAAHGVFVDVGPFLTTGKKTSGVLSKGDFYASSLQAFMWDGMLGAIPRDISNLVVFYNVDLFRKTAVDLPTADWTWQDFLACARKFNRDVDGDGVRDTYGVSFYRKPPLFWLPFVWSAGGALFDNSLSSVRLNEPAAQQGLQFYADWRNRYHIAPGTAESGSMQMSQLFLQQRLAMMVSGRWSVPLLRKQADFNWDVVPLPKGPDGSRVGIDASGYALSAQSKHPEESWELIAFLNSQEAQQAFAESGLIVPARRDVAGSEAFLGLSEPPAHASAFLEVIETGVPTHVPPRWNEVSEELTLALEPVWDGKQTVAEAVAGVTPKIRRLLPGPSSEERR